MLSTLGLVTLLKVKRQVKLFFVSVMLKKHWTKSLEWDNKSLKIIK